MVCGYRSINDRNTTAYRKTAPDQEVDGKTARLVVKTSDAAVGVSEGLDS